VSSTTKLKVLALVGRGQTPQQRKGELSNLEQTFAQMGLGAEIVDSASWYKDFFSRCGDWDSWIWETVVGKDYITRQPRFGCFVVCQTPMGRANAGISRLALRSGTPVLLWKDQAALEKVTEVVETDEADWGAKWGVKVAPNGG